MPVHVTVDADYWDRYPPGLEGMLAVVTAQGLRASVHVLGDASDEASTTAMIVKYPPGYVLPRHAHPCHRLEVVIEGSLQVGDRQCGPGSVLTSNDQNPYGPHEVGPSGCTTMEVFSSREGSHTLLVESPEGIVAVDLASAEALEATATL